jgi:hypothetical protein
MEPGGVTFAICHHRPQLQTDEEISSQATLAVTVTHPV